MTELLTEVRKIGSSWAQFDAYWAQPAKHAKSAPGLVIIHTILGLTEHEKALARTFAELGFVCVAPDLYSHQRMQVPPEDAQEVERILRDVPFNGTFVPGFEKAIASRSRQDQERLRKAARVGVFAPDPNAISDLKVCVSTLCATPGVDHRGVTCIGLSMGGGYAWTLATVEPRVLATVVYYGRPLLPYDQLQKLKGPVLAVHAGEDTRLLELLPEIEAEMSSQGRSFTHITYPKVHHGFLNPEVSTYHQGCTQDAILQALAFLKEVEGSIPKEAEKALESRLLPADAAPPGRAVPSLAEEPPVQVPRPAAEAEEVPVAATAATAVAPPTEPEREAASEEVAAEVPAEVEAEASAEAPELESSEELQAELSEEEETHEVKEEAEEEEAPKVESAPEPSTPEPSRTVAEVPAQEELPAAPVAASTTRPSPPVHPSAASAPPAARPKAAVSAAEVELLLKGVAPVGASRKGSPRAREEAPAKPALAAERSKGRSTPAPTPEPARPSAREKEREREREREKERERERQKEKEREKERLAQRDREKAREKAKERPKEKPGKGKEPERTKGASRKAK